MNVAVTDRFADIVRLHGLVRGTPAQAPPQASNNDPGAGIGESVTFW
jgi:hypothetical protein